MASVLSVCRCEAGPTRWCSALRRGRLPHRLVGEAADSEEAERMLAARRPDLVLLDLASFGKGADELCRRLVAAGEDSGKPAPVIALAPRLDDGERAELIDAGASGYVLSTIDEESMSVALQAIADVTGDAGSHNGGPPGRESRGQFLGMAAAAVAALALPGRALAGRKSARPSPSAPKNLPKLPAPTDGESDVLRMQRELIGAMKKPVAERKWAMVIDLRKCVGCDACTLACKAENQLPPGVVYRPVVEEVIGTYPNVSRRFLPRPCMQCESPPCTPVCPVGATWRREDGVIAIDYEKCIGCRYCLAACPYSARTFDLGEYYSDGTPARQPYEEQVSPEYNEGLRRADGDSPIGNARKCHFCLHRLEAGQLPACVTSCIGHATYFGDLGDPKSLASELIRSPAARRLKEELGTKPRVYYLS